jgi:hypothetical protein
MGSTQTAHPALPIKLPRFLCVSNNWAYFNSYQGRRIHEYQPQVHWGGAVGIPVSHPYYISVNYNI